MSGVLKVAGWIGGGVKWLVSKFSKYLPKTWITALESGIAKCTQWVSSLVTKIGTLSKGESALGKVAGRVDNAITFQAKETVVSATLGKLFNKFPGFEKLMANKQWAPQLAKSLDKPTAKILDDYLIKNAKEFGWEKLRNSICQSRGKNVCDVVDKVALAFAIKAHGKEAVHLTKGSIKNIKLGDKEGAIDKGKKAYTAGEETYGLATGEEGGEEA